MTPKSLLRLPQATSTARGPHRRARFEPVLAEPGVDDAKVTRLILCTGKIYYDLVGHPDRAGNERVAIGRVELLYPFPEQRAARADRALPEPARGRLGAGGAAQHGRARLHGPAAAADHARRRSHYGYIGRPERASPGEGYPAAHAAEQSRIVRTALDLLECRCRAVPGRRRRASARPLDRAGLTSGAAHRVSLANSVSSGSRSPRSTARSTSTQAMPRAAASDARLRLDLLRGEHAAAVAHRGVEPDPLEVAAELLDRVDRADALDLDRDPAVGARRGTSGRPGRCRSATRGARAETPRRTTAGAPASSSCRSRSTPSFSSAAASPISCVDVEQHLVDRDLEPLLAACACAPRSAPAARPRCRSPSAAVIQF